MPDGGGGFFYKHCGFFTLESCFHLCVETCGGFFLILAVVCLGDLSLSDFYRCFFTGQRRVVGLSFGSPLAAGAAGVLSVCVLLAAAAAGCRRGCVMLLSYKKKKKNSWRS